MESKFSVFDALVFGFKSAFDHFRLFFLANVAWFFFSFIGLVLVVVSLGVSTMPLIPLIKDLWMKGCNDPSCNAAIQAMLSSVGSIHLIPFLVTLALVGYVWSSLGLGYVHLLLEFCDTGNSHVSRLFSCFGLGARGLLAMVVYCLICFAGLLLLIFPGIYWAYRFCFFSYFIVDKDAGVIDSLKHSWAITKGQGWNFFGIWVALITISGAGLPLLFLPIGLLSFAYIYRRLEQSHESSAA